MSDLISVIERLRYRRNLERMSQYHLARQIGVTRSALGAYESDRVAMPFSVGLAICRILNLNPRWVIEGKGLSGPFVEFSELKLSDDEVLIRAQDMCFELGYEVFLKNRLELWSQVHSEEELILSMVKDESGDPWVRSCSVRDLEEKRREFLEKAGSDPYPTMAETYRNLAKMSEDELELRRAGKTRSYTKRTEILENENKSLIEDKPLLYKACVVKGSLLSHWIDRANALVSHRGGKAALARHLGLTPQAIHGFLTGASAPSAENILRLQAWVIEAEAKKEIPGSAETLPGTETRKKKSDHENTQSSQESG